MVRRLLFTVVVLALSASIAGAAPFVNPPEASPIVPDGGWAYPFPYQRNALIEFTTDPTTWPNDPVQGKDLVPGVNYHIEGTDDGRWYGSDWFDWSGDLEWHADHPSAGSRQGLIGLSGENSSLDLTWHLDNCPDDGPLKHMWLEYEYFVTGALGGTWGVDPEAGHVVVDMTEDTEALGNGWYRTNRWYLIEPNPTYEDINWHFWTAPTTQGTLLIDHMHVATECVPEPGTCALFGLGVIGLALRRRRKSA